MRCGWGVGCGMWGVGCWVLGVGCWVLGVWGARHLSCNGGSPARGDSWSLAQERRIESLRRAEMVRWRDALCCPGFVGFIGGERRAGTNGFALRGRRDETQRVTVGLLGGT